MPDGDREGQGRVVGVDGCRTGWVVARRDAVQVFENLDEIVADATIAVIGIDMPIGLPSEWGRRADDEARRLLRTRSACVFSTPPRSLLDETTYEAANARSWSVFGRGLPKQTFNLFRRIREVDALSDPDRPDRLVEIHPECAFAAMCGHALPPKRTAIGHEDRRRLLVPVFGAIVDIRPRGARVDDVLDAFAVLWSAERFAREEHVVLGRDAQQGLVMHDERGLPMRIVM